MKDKKFNIGIFIGSCDKYSDLWEPFFYFFKKYWSNCPFPVYLMSNTKAHRYAIPLYTEGKSWTEEMRCALEQFPHDYLLYLQDDYFLTQEVNNSEFEELFSVIQKLKPAYFRLFPHRGPKPGILISKDIQYLSKEELFACSLQAAIWEKQALIGLLDQDENIWKFELLAGNRAKKLPQPFLSIVWQWYLPRKERRYPINYFCTAIRKGKWREDAIDFCEQEGFDVTLINRSIETRMDRFKKKLYDILPVRIQVLLVRYFFWMSGRTPTFCLLI